MTIVFSASGSSLTASISRPTSWSVKAKKPAKFSKRAV
jgi:hypothetical protein